jgi:hypothetical protein
MIGRPAEAAPYYFTYIDETTGDDPIAILESQLEKARAFLLNIAWVSLRRMRDCLENGKNRNHTKKPNSLVSCISWFISGRLHRAGRCRRCFLPCR